MRCHTHPTASHRRTHQGCCHSRPHSGWAQGKITIAQGIDPRSLWSNSSTAQQEVNVSEQITEKLFEFTEDSTGFEPRLATEWKQLDDLTLQIKLRQGVEFTNGEPFDSASAKMSLEAMQKATAYSVYGNMIATIDVLTSTPSSSRTSTPRCCTSWHSRTAASNTRQVLHASRRGQIRQEARRDRPLSSSWNG